LRSAKYLGNTHYKNAITAQAADAEAPQSWLLFGINWLEEEWLWKNFREHRAARHAP